MQWLRSQINGKLKLNDFNNAELLNLNTSPGAANDTIFCKADRGYGAASINHHKNLYTEWEINNIYTLKTGLKN